MSSIQCVVCREEKEDWTMNETLGPVCNTCAPKLEDHKDAQPEKDVLASTGWGDEISGLMESWENRNPEVFEGDSEVKPS